MNSKSVVMVVDDERMLVDVLKDFFELKNYRVLVSYDGDEALETLKNEEVEIIFSDINMPNLDGVSLMKVVRSRYPEVKIVLMTGYSSSLTDLDAIKKDADAYISKPFKLNVIDNVLRKLRV